MIPLLLSLSTRIRDLTLGSEAPQSVYLLRKSAWREAASNQTKAMIHHFGIDIAKDTLAICDGNRSFEIPNQRASIQRWLRSLKEPARIAMESTGKYGELLASLAFQAGHEVFVIPPTWIRHHRISTGVRAKTDKVDARAIYRFILETQRHLRPWKPMPEQLQKLVQIRKDRAAAVKALGAFRMQAPTNGRPSEVVKALEQHIAALEKDIIAILGTYPQSEILQSVPGVGPQATAIILPILLHRQFQNADQFAAFAGLDPTPVDSGLMRGTRRISKRGDRHLRGALYMAAVSASRSLAFKATYAKLKTKLKAKQALIALARRISKILLALFKTNSTFQPQRVASTL